MRITDRNERLEHTLGTINYFMSNEHNYYSNYNVRKFTYDGIEYSSLYKRLNVQLLVTKKCPFNCKFCIEKVNPVGNEDRNEEKQLENLKKVLLELKQNGMFPTVSITGGEPTLYCSFVKKVKTMLDELGVTCNINTAGLINKDTEELISEFERINLSVHHYDADKNAAVFGAVRSSYWDNKIFERATIQSVLTEPDYDYLVKFLSSFSNPRFSIRFPACTKADPSIEWKYLFRKMEKDERFRFVQQKIGDYYWYEDWVFTGPNNKEQLVRFSFASISQLEYYKSGCEKDKNFVRAVVILPNGDVKFDWIE